MSAVLTIDKSKVRRSFASATNSYDELATLQRKVGLKLLQQFSGKDNCQQLVDVGCGTGFLPQQLIERGFSGQVIAIDIALSMLQKSKKKLESSNNVLYICADAEFMPLNNNSVNMLISNLALQWCQNLSAVLSGFNKILKQDGRLLFSTFGPATLQELKQAWAQVDDYTHVNEFYSADDIDCFLQQSGFKDIKISSQIYRPDYSTVMELMRELKGIGAHNVLSQRNRKTTSKTAMQTMISGYQRKAGGTGVTATYEIFFVSVIKK